MAKSFLYMTQSKKSARSYMAKAAKAGFSKSRMRLVTKTTKVGNYNRPKKSKIYHIMYYK